MNIRDTFRGGDEDAGVGDTGHLSMILAPVKSEVVIVNFTDASKATADHTCIVESSEHPWLNKQSAVAYDRVWHTTIANLDAGVVKNEFVPKSPLSYELHLKILRGAIESERSPGYLKQAAQDYLAKLESEKDPKAES